ncbi:MAG: AAA family ATPase [Acidobacteriota bacterium]
MSLSDRDFSLGFLVQFPELREAAPIPRGFFKTAEQRAVWEALKELGAAGEPVQLVTIAEKVKGNGIATYLDAITSGLVPMKPKDFRARILRQLADDTKRRMQGLAAQEGADLDEIAGLAEEARRLELEAEGEIGEPTFKRLSEIEGREIDWLWPGRIPMGMLTLLVGDPGLGKSFVATWISSRLSVGASLPGGPDQDPAPTVYLSAEDSPAYALQPRALKNGADLSKIIVLKDSAFDIEADLEKIRVVVQTMPDVRLLIIDPLNGYIGETDYFKDPAVRTKLTPLVQFAEERGIAVLAIMHLNKRTDQAGIYRIGGSIAFAGIARSILAVTQDPADPDRRFLRPLKMNYCRKPDPLAFRIGEDLALIFEDGPADIGADESLSVPTGKEAAEGPFATRWLTGHLAAGSVELADILKSARAVGISRSSLFRARERLNIQHKTSGFGKRRSSFWELPESYKSPSRVL